MKTKKTLLLLTAAALLASCAGGDNPSSSVSEGPSSRPDISELPDSSSHLPDSGSVIPDSDSGLSSDDGESSLPYVDPTPDYTAAEVYAFLKQAVDTTNFTVEETALSGGILPVTYSTYYTPNYVHYSYSDAGYVKLKDYTGESTLIYNYSSAESPVVENAVSYTLDPDSLEQTPVRDVETLNPLVDGMKELEAEDILLNYDYFYSKDSTLAEAFAYFVGASSLASKIFAVTFSFNEAKDELTFGFAPNFNANPSDSEVKVIDSLQGKLVSVGKTSIATLDAFVSSYSLPEVSLSEDEVATISGSGAYHSKVVFSYEANAADVVEQEDEVVFTPDAEQRRRVESGTTSAAYSYITKDEASGNAVDNYLDYKNEVVKKDLGRKFEDVAKSPSSLLESKAFRKTAEGTYSYFGYQGRKLVNDLAGFDCGSILSAEVKVADGKIAEFHAVTPVRTDSYGQKMHFSVSVLFQQEGSIQTIVPVKDDDYTLMGALSNIQDIWGMISTMPYSFSALIETKTGNSAAYKTKLSLFKRSALDSFNNVLLFDKESVDTAEGSAGDPIHIRWGYYQKSASSKGVVPFKVNEQGQAIASEATVEDKNLIDILGFDADNKIFKQVSADEEKGQWTYQLREEVKGIEDHILGGDQLSSIIPASLALDVGNFKPSGISYTIKTLNKIEYEFNGFGMYKGKESVTFSDYDSTVAPEDLDFSALQDWIEPETWDKGAPEVYPVIAASFGEDTASKIPFLYQKEMEGNWITDKEAKYDEWPSDGIAYRWMVLDNTTFFVFGDNEVSKAYMVAFGKKLEANGFVKTDNYPLGGFKSDVGSYYSETLDLYVRVPETVSSGIRFLRKENIGGSSSEA